MTIDSDTDDLLLTTIWGEEVTIIRNTPTYDDTGAPTDSWAVIITCNADIQPISGVNPTVEVGQKRTSTHRIFLPDETAITQGDRIRPAGWGVGDNFYEVDDASSRDSFVEIYATLVRGAA